ncbi:sensor histidine kinase [Pseudonocardia thermophila]|uniref:sensor histidine kinase n=1 Tax=Pseudonocardia thermophila TaxID=1848 RepID=UPI00248DC6B8|nr:sensor histidine kinase [Pseudonocardia thermophila]
MQIRRPPWWEGLLPTVVLPAVVGIVTVAGSVFASARFAGFRPLDTVGVLLLLVGPVALVFRAADRRVALGVIAAATVAWFLLGYAYGPVLLPLFVGLVSAVLAGHRRAVYPIVGGTYIVLVGYHLVRTGDSSWSGAVGSGAAFWLAVLTAVIAASEGIRARRERAAHAAAAAAEAERHRGVQERLRIAQELHDVLGHHVSLINVQAGVALYLLDEDPEQARTALAAIKQSSKELLREMRATLGVLRAVDEPPPHHPVPGIDRLDALIGEVRAAGLPVELIVAGEERPVPPSVDLAAYRIVQEALTNVRRHAGPATTARVRLTYAEDALVVQIDDDGAGAAAGETGGSGIAGMRERANALGGSMEAGPLPGRGFRVRATLPVGRGDEA